MGVGRSRPRKNTFLYRFVDIIDSNQLLIMNKKVKIGEKVYELKEVEIEGESTEETPVETPVVETPITPEVGTPTTPEVGTPIAEENVDEKIDAVAEKIVATLGLADIHKKLDALSAEKTTNSSSKALNLLDLETLMNKDVSQMKIGRAHV